MKFTDLLSVLIVDDFPSASAFYRRFFGRGPDREPMAACAEWRIAQGGAVQVFGDTNGAGAATVLLGVDDVDGRVAELSGRGIEMGAFNTPNGKLRLGVVKDPAGNTLMLVQRLD